MNNSIRSSCPGSSVWWEVEGCSDLDGEFECVEVSALQHGLITMPIKQFALLADLAYHVCALEAEVEGQPHLPTGQEWLRTLAAWLLLKLANGWDEARIAETFAISQATVKNVARRFAEEYARVVRLPRR